MINLLPPEVKEDYRYARRNRQLAKWLLVFFFAILGVAAITGFGIFTMNNTSNTYKARIAATQADLASQDLNGVSKKVTEISGNLRLMVQVLSKEILFSKLLARLGNATPPNVALTNLSISQTESAIDITAQTSNYAAATQLQANLADPANKIFSKADIVSISCSSKGQLGYPCTANIRALFTANNPFLFINAGKATP